MSSVQNNWQKKFFQKSNILLGKKLPEQALDNIRFSLELFQLLLEKKFDEISKSERVKELRNSADQLMLYAGQMSKKAGSEDNRNFFAVYRKAIQDGLNELDHELEEFEQTNLPSTDEIGSRLKALEKEYKKLMLSGQPHKVNLGLEKSEAEESDRLETFIKLTDELLKNRFALEQAKKLLKENLRDEEINLEKFPVELAFSVNRDQKTGTFRTAPFSKSIDPANILTVCDYIDRLKNIKMLGGEDSKLIDDNDVIRFIRLHSEPDKLFSFKDDRMSQIAEEMYLLIADSLIHPEKLINQVLALINKTNVSDLKKAHEGVSSEECRELFRAKFKTILPIINERRYYANRGKARSGISARTENSVALYEKELKRAENKTFSSSKGTLAMMIWVRRFLTQVLKASQEYQKKQEAAEKEPDENVLFTRVENKTPASELAKPKVDLSQYVFIGVSNTIGDEDMINFYMEAEDLIEPQKTMQHSEKRGKMMVINKGEKLHRIKKKEFFQILNDFFKNHLNPALKKHGFDQVKLQENLFLEIWDRLEDQKRTRKIVAGVLGAGMKNLDTFLENKDLELNMRKMFQRQKYNNLHYPVSDKYRVVANYLAKTGGAMLEMQYRRVFKASEEIENMLPPTGQNQFSGSKKILDMLLKIMEISRPRLKNIRNENSFEV